MYHCLHQAHSEWVNLRGLRYHVWTWNSDPAPADPALPLLVLVHGWMDVGASYQFMVDALSPEFKRGRRIVAPDWRGFGLTQTPALDHYFFPDYLADLDFLLHHYAADQAVDLVGHSMGGNVAMTYAGVRPERIRRLVNLEGFGMPASEPKQAPGRYARWLDELHSLHRGELGLKDYGSLEGVAQRLIKTNPRLSLDKAQWLAQHWAQEQTQPDGSTRWRILGDAAHKVVSAQLYRVDETMAVWQRISAPVLAVEAQDNELSRWYQGRYTLAEYHQRLKHVAKHQIAHIAEAGHMLHHDQPQALAALLTSFLA